MKLFVYVVFLFHASCNLTSTQRHIQSSAPTIWSMQDSTALVFYKDHQNFFKPGSPLKNEHWPEILDYSFEFPTTALTFQTRTYDSVQPKVSIFSIWNPNCKRDCISIYPYNHNQIKKQSTLFNMLSIALFQKVSWHVIESAEKEKHKGNNPFLTFYQEISKYFVTSREHEGYGLAHYLNSNGYRINVLAPPYYTIRHISATREEIDVLNGPSDIFEILNHKPLQKDDSGGTIYQVHNRLLNLNLKRQTCLGHFLKKKNTYFIDEGVTCDETHIGPKFIHSSQKKNCQIKSVKHRISLFDRAFKAIEADRSKTQFQNYIGQCLSAKNFNY